MSQALRWLVFVLLLVGCASAQVVRVENLSPVPFAGWKRTTIDRTPPREVGMVGPITYVVGRRIGLDARVVDLRVTLAPGQKIAVDLASATESTWTRAPLPADMLWHFGGPTTFAGQPMAVVGLIEDGAGYTAQFRGRAGRMICSNVWITWYPDQPGWACGEAITVASNPAVPDMVEVAPAGLDLRFGDALVLLPGRGMASLIPAGTRVADGQGRATPITFVWLRHLTDPNAWASVGCVSSLGVGAVGIERLLPEGNPSFPAGFSARAWAGTRFAQAVRKLATWEPPICGPAPASGVTGAQEDQLVHPGGEALRTDGVGAEWVRYLAALHLHSARPCNHLEIDGRPLDVDAHPQARFWDSRIHWHTGVSTDRLGKPRSLTVEEASGFWGPDTQHFLTGTLVASARLTGSPACQWLLRNLATVYLLQRTLDGSTAGIFSAREVGYECLWAVACHETLEDRAMAARVVARCRSRMRNVVLPFIGQRDYVVAQIDHWGPGWWVALWEGSLCAYGLDLFGRILNEPLCLPVARRLADRALRDGWVTDGITWRTCPMFPLSVTDAIGEEPVQPEWGASGAQRPEPPDDFLPNYMAEDAGLEAGIPVATHDFDRFGMPLCAWVVLRQEPTHQKARAVWDYLNSDPNGARNWMPPGVGQ